MTELQNKIKLMLDNDNSMINMALALEYDGGIKEVFNTVKEGYITNYSRFTSVEELKRCNEFNPNITMEMIIHKMKGISLYLGTQELYDYSVYLLGKIRQNEKVLDDELDLLIKLNTRIINELKQK